MNAVRPRQLYASMVPSRANRSGAFLLPLVGTSSVRLLLAESNRPVRSALARLLEFDGYLVRTAATGADLLEEVSDWVLGLAPVPFDVIVTACRLPTLDPISIVAGLRALGWDGPIVVLSESPDETHTRPVGDLDGVDVVQRTACPEALELRLQQLVGNHPHTRSGA